MSVLSRRSFLGGATLGAAALAGSPIAAFASTKVPAKWDETTSFLIIGRALPASPPLWKPTASA